MSENLLSTSDGRRFTFFLFLRGVGGESMHGCRGLWMPEVSDPPELELQACVNHQRDVHEETEFRSSS